MKILSKFFVLISLSLIVQSNMAYSQNIIAKDITITENKEDKVKYYYKEGLSDYQKAKEIIAGISLNKRFINVEEFTSAMKFLWYAKHNFSKALEIEPENIEANISMGQLYITSGDICDNLDSKFLDINQDLFQAFYGFDSANYLESKGISLKTQYYYQQAAEILTKFNNSNKNSGLGYYHLAKLNDNPKWKNSSHELVKEYINKAINIEPNNADYYNYRGNIFLFAYENILNNENFSFALSDFNKAISLEPNKAIYYNNLGYLLSLKNETKEALENFNKSINLEPDNKLIAENYKKFLISILNKSPEKTLSILKDISRNEPLSPLMKNTISLVYTQIGVNYLLNKKKKENAIHSFEKALTFDNENNLAKEYLQIAKTGTNKL